MVYGKQCPVCGGWMDETEYNMYQCFECGRAHANDKPEQKVGIWALFWTFIIICLVYKPVKANDDVHYMAEAIYFEARDQALVGQIAVGCVIKNRIEHKRWSNNVRDVVHQPKQFSYYSDGKPEVYNDTKSHYIAVQMAKHVLYSDACDMYDTINHYINHSIANPKAVWYKQMEFIMKVGDHSFYKTKY